jgi:hypothetical protein
MTCHRSVNLSLSEYLASILVYWQLPADWREIIDALSEPGTKTPIAEIGFSEYGLPLIHQHTSSELVSCSHVRPSVYCCSRHSSYYSKTDIPISTSGAPPDGSDHRTIISPTPSPSSPRRARENSVHLVSSTTTTLPSTQAFCRRIAHQHHLYQHTTKGERFHLIVKYQVVLLCLVCR